MARKEILDFQIANQLLAMCMWRAWHEVRKPMEVCKTIHTGVFLSSSLEANSFNLKPVSPNTRRQSPAHKANNKPTKSLKCLNTLIK